MNNTNTLESFYELVIQHRQMDMPLRDAIELAAAITGGNVAAKVTHAMAKYQEAMHPQSHLSHEENINALALMSMGALWDNEYFSALEVDDNLTQEHVLAEAVYFIMRYSQDDSGGTLALEQSAKEEKNVALRQNIINRILGRSE